MAKLRMKTVKRSTGEMNRLIAGILRKNDVPDWEYSFDGAEEQCQCMEKENDCWRIYFVERGMEHGCAEFGTQKEAARELLSRLGRTEESRTKMLAELETEWKPMKVVAVREHSIENIEWKAAGKPAAHIYDQNGKLVATVKTPGTVDRTAAEQIPKMQTELLKKRIQELETHLKQDGAAASKPVHKHLLRYGTKKMLRKKMDEKIKNELRRERPDLGWKG